jgi:sec-independent protein translocase protein TatB
MLDIGFAELLVVSAIALFVVGPERLPSALRSMSLWVGRVRRGFEEIKADVSREMHNEEVMRALKESRDEVQDIADVSSALSIEPPTTINTTINTTATTRPPTRPPIVRLYRTREPSRCEC